MLVVKIALQYVRGFFMGSADIVPGVSGGTVALVLGIYRELIANVRAGAQALKRLATGDPKGFASEFVAIGWLFIIPLGAGVVSAFLVLRHPMKVLLVDHPEGTAAVFSGLVLASCVLVWRQITVRDGMRLGVLASVSAAAFVLLGLQSGTNTDPALWMFGLTGSIAICAMILPGISGSFIMLMMGMYAAVIGGAPIELAVFLVGAVIGLAFFSSALNWLLQNHEQTVLAALLGLMVGSLRVLWPWPNGVGVVSDDTSENISGTSLELPSLAAGLSGLGLAVAAAAITLLIVRYAEDTDMVDDGVNDDLVPSPHNS